MSCECYRVGGPWITYDPSCPTHGDEAREREAEQAQVAYETEQLHRRVERLEDQLADVNERFGDYAFHKGYLSPVDAESLRSQLDCYIIQNSILRRKLEELESQLLKS